MAQHDYVIDNGSGSAVRGDINTLAEAIATQNSGTTAPAVTFPFMFWSDTTANVLKQRNAANTTWITVFNLDGSLPDDSVTNAKLRNSAALSVIGRSANSSGDPADIAGTDGQVLRVSGTTLAFGTIATAGLADNAATDAKLRQSAGLSVVGRSANSTGNVADITGTDGQALRVSGTTLGFGTLATAAYADNSVTDAKLRDSAALSVIGRASNSSGDPADIAAANDGEVLRRSGTSIGFGTLATAGLADDAVTNAKLANMAQNTIKGRITASTGDPEDLTAANVKTILALVKADVGLGNVDNTSDATKWAATATLTNKTFDANGTGNVLSNVEVADFAGAAVVTAAEGLASSDNDTSFPTTAAVIDAIEGAVASGVADGDKGDITVSGSGLTWTVDALAITSGKVAANAITNAKLAQMAVNTIKGRITSGTGDPEDLTATNVKTILALTQADISGLTTASSPQFTGIELGHASDTTITRSAAGVIAIEGVPIYSNIPQNSQSTAYTTVLSDAQKHMFHPAADNNARTFTIAANGSVAYPIGTALTFINEINVLSIAINTDTLVLAGAGTTGTRTLAANGMATAIKVTSTKWYISGSGLT